MSILRPISSLFFLGKRSSTFHRNFAVALEFLTFSLKQRHAFGEVTRTLNKICSKQYQDPRHTTLFRMRSHSHPMHVSLKERERELQRLWVFVCYHWRPRLKWSNSKPGRCQNGKIKEAFTERVILPDFWTEKCSSRTKAEWYKKIDSVRDGERERVCKGEGGCESKRGMKVETVRQCRSVCFCLSTLHCIKSQFFPQLTETQKISDPISSDSFYNPASNETIEMNLVHFDAELSELIKAALRCSVHN